MYIFICMYVCVYIYVCIYIYDCVCIYIYMCMYMYIVLYMYVCIEINIFTCACLIHPITCWLFPQMANSSLQGTMANFKYSNDCPVPYSPISITIILVITQVTHQSLFIISPSWFTSFPRGISIASPRRHPS